MWLPFDNPQGNGEIKKQNKTKKNNKKPCSVSQTVLKKKKITLHHADFLFFGKKKKSKLRVTLYPLGFFKGMF